MWQRLALPSEQSGKEISGLTGLRGFAACWVMACHAWYFFGMPELSFLGVPLTKLVSEGWLGVLLFFILSGRLLAPPFLRWRAGIGSKPDLRRYLTRRVLRVFPAYYVQLLILLVAYRVFQGEIPFSGLDWLRHLTMQLDPAAQLPSVLNPIWWTLPVEFGFYLALPLLAYLFVGGRAWLCLTVCVALYLVHLRIGTLIHAPNDATSLALFSRHIPGYLFCFAAGIALASWSGSSKALGRWMPTVAGLVMLACLIAIIPTENAGFGFWTTPSYYYGWKLAVCVPLALMVFLAGRADSPIARFFSMRGWIYLGQISYSLYLWHFPVMQAVSAAIPEQSLGAQAAKLLISVVASMLLAHLSARFVELPFMRWGRRNATPLKG